MTDKTERQPLATLWLYCHTCNISHPMVFVQFLGAYAIYHCPNCKADRSVLRATVVDKP